MDKTSIKNILDMAQEVLSKVKTNLGDNGFQGFLNRKEFYYNGLLVGHSLNDYLAEAVYRELTATERKEFEEWVEAHFSRITSPIEHGPRGEYYDYVECFDGKIYAVGEEEGNYAGGHVASMSYGGRLAIARHCTYFKKESSLPRQKDLYEKIKDMPIITEDEYRQLKEQRQKWPRDFNYWLWFE